MSNKCWFKPKRYGWGFTPISHEGWIATLVMLVLVLTSAYTHNFFTNNILLKDGLGFLIDLIVILSVSTIIFLKRTKGKVKWNWGDRGIKLFKRR